MTNGFQDRVVIVTGGGTGIGRAAALRFAALGARVVVTGRRSGPLREIERESDAVAGIEADATREDDAARVLADVRDRWGRLDALVNNAGMFAARPLEATTPELVSDLFNANVLGPTLMSRAALPLLEASAGAIVNVSSSFGHKPAPGSAHYAASKAALEMLTRSWALELAPRAIRVNAVAPGPTETEILARSGLPPQVVESVKEDEARRIPLRRRGTPPEVAHWIVELADPGASWVTGQVLAVDGGLAIS